MTRLNNHSSEFERKAFVVSFFFHIFIGLTFVITFPTKSVAHKPLLVFWGSILESQDILSLVPLADVSRLDKKRSVPLSFRQSRYHPTDSRDVSKPTFFQELGMKPKKWTKSLFIEKREEPQNVPTLDELGIKQSVPERIPLRLYKDND